MSIDSSLVSSKLNHSLPQQWANEMALATSTASTTMSTSDQPPTSTSPPETLGGPIFDRQLDGFLDRFQQEIVTARALKDELDHTSPTNDHIYQTKKILFKQKMERIKALFSTEGEDFVSSLEKRNPKLTIAACGENTLELAQGIERLESAVKEEETKRTGITDHSRSSINVVHLRSNGDVITSALGKPEDQGKTIITSPQRVLRQPSLPRVHIPSTIGHTLNNLSSDETLQLMQSDIQALKLELMRLQRSKAHGDQLPPQHHNPPTITTIQTATADSNGAFSFSSLSPERKHNLTTNINGVPPSILANNNVNVVRVTGRANSFAPTYVSHLEQMKSRLEALEKKPLSRRAKSAARLGRTQTMGSTYDSRLGHSTDENQNPNVSAMITPPRTSRRITHRSISTQSPLQPISNLSPSSVHFHNSSPPSSSPSPNHPTFRRIDESSPSNTPARLFFDGPEDLLARPQSHAAARDIQRYSLKVARRFGPAESSSPIPEPRAKSAVTVSPSRRRGIQNENMQISHTLSDVGTTNIGPPSTIDTSGSGGRVVEAIEGDVWVRKGVVWKRWRRRYASIISNQFFGKVMCLFSYDSSGGVMSTRSQIVVLQGARCNHIRDRVDIGGEPKCVFKLRTTAREYFFAVKNEDIRRNWIRELHEAARQDTARLAQAVKGRSMAFRRKL